MSILCRDWKIINNIHQISGNLVIEIQCLRLIESDICETIDHKNVQFCKWETKIFMNKVQDSEFLFSFLTIIYGKDLCG